jgi:myo-inositol 2-dehydrogenase/D-chiro-inositol 1-dehydrogenase
MINIGILGGGRIGRVHAEGITNGVKNACVKSIADPFLNDTMKMWAAEFGITECYTDHMAILNDPQIDAVLICTSTDTHADMAIASIKAGKHVFCEKPVSQDLSKIREVMEALKNSKVKFQVGFNRRFDHNYRAVHDAVADGAIGDVHMVKITARDPELPPLEYIRGSGGMFLDMSIHDFDMVRFLSGSEVEEVFAYGTALVNPAVADEGDIDTAVISMKMANGSIALIDNSRQAVYGYDQRAEVFGSKGQVSMTNDTPSTSVISTITGIVSEKPLWFFLERFMKSFSLEVEAFVNAIEMDTEVPVDIHAGLAPVLIAMAANKSMEENRPVKITEVAV